MDLKQQSIKIYKMYSIQPFFRSDLRGQVQHLLLRPDSASQYASKVIEVTDDFIDMIRRKRDPETFVYPAEDFLLEV